MKHSYILSLFLSVCMVILTVVVGGVIVSNRMSILLHASASEMSYYLFDWEEWQEGYDNPSTDPNLRFLDCYGSCDPADPLCDVNTECAQAYYTTAQVLLDITRDFEQAGLASFVQYRDFDTPTGTESVVSLRYWLVDDEKVTLIRSENTFPAGEPFYSVYEGGGSPYIPIPTEYDDRFNGRNWRLQSYDRVWGVVEDQPSSHTEIEAPYVVAEVDWDIGVFWPGGIYSGGRESAIIKIVPGILERSP